MPSWALAAIRPGAGRYDLAISSQYCSMTDHLSMTDQWKMGLMASTTSCSRGLGFFTALDNEPFLRTQSRLSSFVLEVVGASCRLTHLSMR